MTTASLTLTSAAYIQAWKDAPAQPVFDALTPWLGASLVPEGRTAIGTIAAFGESEEHVEILNAGDHGDWAGLSRAMGEAAIDLQAPYLRMARATIGDKDRHRLAAQADVNGFRWVLGAFDRAFRACATEEGTVISRLKARRTFGLAAGLLAEFVATHVAFAQDVDDDPFTQLMFFMGTAEESRRLRLPEQPVAFHGITWRERALSEGAATLLLMDFPVLPPRDERRG